MWAAVRFYLRSKTTSIWRYIVSESLQAVLGWVPGILGIGLRAVAYKLVLRGEGFAAIEDSVRFCRPEDIRLGARVYVDHGVYLHGGRGGLEIGAGAWIMNGCRLQVFNFRDIDRAGIRIGRRTFVGEGTIMRGQGGIHIGDNVLFGPGAQVLAVNHLFGNPGLPVMDQGITAEGIRIDDNCWIGAGAIVLDGVTIGRGSCVGAGSVVTKSIPPHSLAVGSPARVIRDLLAEPIAPPDLPVFRGGMEQFA